MYKNLKNFIEKAKERVFNDAFMRVVFVEIKLKSGEIPHDLILPRYKGFALGDTPRKGEHLHCYYQGEKYEYSTKIKDYCPPKALQEAEELVKEGAKFNFKNYADIALWIHEKTEISMCSLSALGLPEYDFY